MTTRVYIDFARCTLSGVDRDCGLSPYELSRIKQLTARMSESSNAVRAQDPLIVLQPVQTDIHLRR